MNKKITVLATVILVAGVAAGLVACSRSQATESIQAGTEASVADSSEENVDHEAEQEARPEYTKVEEPEEEAEEQQAVSENNLASESSDETTSSNEIADYEVIETDEATMYAKSTVNTRSLPSTDGDILGNLSASQEVQVVGYVEKYKGEDCLWYLLKDKSSDKSQFVNGGYLLDKKPTAEAKSNTNTQQSAASTQQSSATATQQPAEEEYEVEYYYDEQYAYDNWDDDSEPENVIEISPDILDNVYVPDTWHLD